MELDNNKKEIITTKEPKVIVNSNAGSGKTAIITERVKYLLNNKKENIVVLTFTNMAANEMSKRITESGIDLGNTFIGTIHSYCAQLLFRNGIIQASQAIEEQNFDKLFEIIKENKQCVPKVNYLLLDEAQDSTEQQFEFILDILKPNNYFIVGDPRQSIFSFNGARPDILFDLCNQYDTKVYNLNKNYRCKSNILAFSRNIINKLNYKYWDTSSSDKDGGKVYEMEFTPENVLKAIERDKESEYKDWFILVRSNEQVQNIYNYLVSHNIPCDTFKKSELDNNSLEQKMKENTIKVLTIHSAKGLENKNVIVGSFHFTWNDEERRLAYVAATRAIENLYWFKPKNKKKTRQNKIVNWE